MSAAIVFGVFLGETSGPLCSAAGQQPSASSSRQLPDAANIDGAAARAQVDAACQRRSVRPPVVAWQAPVS